MTTLRRSVPSRSLATSAPREVAIAKTVTSRVTATQSHPLSRPCFHEVSSMWAESARLTYSRSSSTEASSSAAACRSSREIIPMEIDSPSRSEANWRIGRLPRR